MRPSTIGRDVLVVVAAAVVIAAVAASLMSALPVPGRGAERSRPGNPADGDLAFVDVAQEIGLDFQHGAFRWQITDDPVSMLGSGLCWIDFDRDGWLDLFVVNDWTEAEWDHWQDEGGVPTSRLFRNERGSFVDVTAETGTALDFHGQGCVAADFDDDGFQDLYVTSTRANAMLWNQRIGAFSDGAADAGVEADGWSTGAAAGDVNGDGLLDLLVVQPDDRQLLYLNLGDRQFVEAGAELGLEPVPGGIDGALVDVDGDLDLDVVVTAPGSPATIQVNDQADTALGVFFSTVVDTSSLRIGPGWDGASWADFDLDGNLDRFDAVGDLDSAVPGPPIYEAGPDLAGRTIEVGLTDISIVARASAAADYDNDGDLDVAVGSVGGRLVLLSNRGAGGHWLSVDTSRFAPGTVVTVVARDGTTWTRQVVAGSSFLSSEDPRALFGLGTLTRVEQITVVEPDGSELSFGGTRTNRRVGP